MRWTLLVPVKLADPKTRLASTLPPDAPAHLHGRLVSAMRADALSAAAATAQVARVLIVTDQPAELDAGAVLVQRSAGLNGALRDGAAHAAAQWPDDGIAALVGDLPALRSNELGSALDMAARSDRAFVPDSEGTGTTLLAARPGVALHPQFGVGSAARHALHATAVVDAGAGLRRDVDIGDDLLAALALGVGAATCAACNLMPGCR